MRTPTARQRPKQAQNALFPAPVAGWIANRARGMASSAQAKLPPGATILENWFPTTTGARLRRGTVRHATLGVGNQPVLSLFSYNVGAQQQLFAATRSAIWDVTTVPSTYGYVVGDDGEIIGDDEEEIGVTSTSGLEVLEDTLGGRWVVVQTTNSDGGTFLRGVNGVDVPFVYDGASFGTTPALTFDVGDVTEPQDLSYVWAYKRRLFFIKKDSLDAYYLPVNAIGGELALLPLGAVFSLGGKLLFGASWSLGTSDQGGLSAQCVFVTSEGEVAVYQGSNPDDPADWRLVGVYRIGKPLGAQAHISAGGDIVIATTLGLLPLSEAVQREYAALSPAAVSAPIEDAWREAVSRRSGEEWAVTTWPDGGMVLVAPPMPAVESPQVFVANANTGAWCKFTGWNVRCMTVFRNQLYFGSDAGAVMRGWTGGSDEGEVYTGRYLGLFDDLSSPAARKVVGLARATLTASVDVIPRVSVAFDFHERLPVAPDAATAPVGNLWDAAIWDQSVWDGDTYSVVSSRWVSVGGSGARVAPSVQVSSGSAVPLDAELLSVELTFKGADIVT